MSTQSVTIDDVAAIIRQETALDGRRAASRILALLGRDQGVTSLLKLQVAAKAALDGYQTLLESDDDEELRAGLVELQEEALCNVVHPGTGRVCNRFKYHTGTAHRETFRDGGWTEW